MYVKFCRVFLEDKKDEVSESLPPKLSVELDGDGGKQTGGNVRLYRAACLFLGLICLTLLLAVVILSVKLQTGSTVCLESKETDLAGKKTSFATTCSFQQCQTYFPKTQRCQCQQCAPGWQAFERSCFYFSTSRLNWDESLQNCTGEGGSLAIISSQKVQSFLAQQGNMKYWIGLRQRGATWTWVNQTPVQASHWVDASQEGDCGYLDGQGPSEKNWKRAGCNSYAYFVCQINL